MIHSPNGFGCDLHDIMDDVVSTSSCGCSSAECGCVIDVSSPATLERDFHAWLMGVNPSVSEPFYPSMELTKVDGAEVADETPTTPAPPNHLTESGKPDGRKTRRKGTNLYGRPYCPGRPLSMEERTRIIELHMGGMKVNAISKALCISHGCVSKIISRYRSTGILSPASSPEQRRTRRKKNDSPPSLQVPEYKEYKEFKTDYGSPPEYGLPMPYMTTTAPPELLTHTQYTLFPDNLMMHDYHTHILL